MLFCMRSEISCRLTLLWISHDPLTEVSSGLELQTASAEIIWHHILEKAYYFFTEIKQAMNLWNNMFFFFFDWNQKSMCSFQINRAIRSGAPVEHLQHYTCPHGIRKCAHAGKIIIRWDHRGWNTVSYCVLTGAVGTTAWLEQTHVNCCI